MLFNILSIFTIIVGLLFLVYTIITKDYKEIILPLIIITFNLWFFAYSGFIPMSRLYKFYWLGSTATFVVGFIFLFGFSYIFSKTSVFKIGMTYIAVILAIISTSYFVILFIVFFEFAVVFD